MAKQIKLTIKIPDYQDLKNSFSKFTGKEAAGFDVTVRKIFGDIMKKKYYSLALAMLFFVLWWQLSLTAAIFWILFLSFLLYQWDSRDIALLALISLASCPFLLIFKKEALAEQMAIYAYYFLVITVVLQIVEYWGSPKDVSDKQSED